ncbi:hypothetical protein XENORESO_018032 [Xenotaenia resolanae]|uniref:Secreted protein n=1 Tax=Xenotaenia resolanae TaxID=208358 RepID=A0ABV0X952_9TELE
MNRSIFRVEAAIRINKCWLETMLVLFRAFLIIFCICVCFYHPHSFCCTPFNAFPALLCFPLLQSGQAITHKLHNGTSLYHITHGAVRRIFTNSSSHGACIAHKELQSL